jgi:hypothetical protein
MLVECQSAATMMISIHDATLHQEVEWSYLLKSIRANLYASSYRHFPRSGLYQPLKILRGLANGSTRKRVVA